MKFNLTDQQKQMLLSIVVGALMSILAVLTGRQLAPAAPAAPAGGTIGVKDFISTGIKCSASADPCVESDWGRNFVVYSDQGTTQQFKVNGATGAVSIGTDTFSGVTRYGVTTTVATGSIIPHGYSVTPTVVMLFAATAPAGGSIYTPTVTSINAISFTVLTSNTVPTLYWFAGK